ncbi:ROK family protein [Corynebacterium cystitidis]|uniref:Glucokinase n=1 Tax=Corynebacterium cystitidis DSM 20524 TaxID=1121357 RepID=A0A1H9NN11_9CORY|nr:ROK family protein [Corynebacterium cystitidis]WJY82800.1 Glucokinase [Corynebacterium cystitidis DSM 20524]SER37350.1 glucokinase [Corynebacterium cystitidis DSM 20524]SNV70370.1 glucose kinase [Corynebacterium cystitidis]
MESSPPRREALTVGFDIGGTNTRASVVTHTGAIIDQASVRTPETARDMEEAIVKLTEDLRSRHEIAAVGVAAAGFLDPDREIIRFAPHLPWRNDAPVRQILQDSIGLPVSLEHDANAAAWGEYRFGAARDLETWVFFAVGTGIGATLMHRGEIYRGSFGTAPEFGHITVVPGGRVCSCGKQGCLERYASGTALLDTAIHIATQGCYEDTSLYRRVVGKRATGDDVMQAARNGDKLGLATVANFAGWLGQGLSIVADVLDPELIVLGGGVSADADMFLPKTKEQLAANIVGSGYRPLPRVVVAELGPAAGMIGVSDLARDSL